MSRTLRSIVDPAWLAGVAAREYGLEVSGCVLLRSLVNEVYRVDTGGTAGAQAAGRRI